MVIFSILMVLPLINSLVFQTFICYTYMDFVIGFASQLGLLPHSGPERLPIRSSFPFFPL